MSETSAPLVAMRNAGSELPQRRVTALAGFDLTLQDGEFRSLLGPSGCGKSTALYYSQASVSRAEGSIALVGCRGPAGRPPQRESALFSSEPTLMPWANVLRRMFILPLRLQRRSAIERRAALSTGGSFKVSDCSSLHAPIHANFLAGMRMRVSIARALVTKPKLVLMDEPICRTLDEISTLQTQ